MARERSITIFAENREEFEEVYKQNINNSHLFIQLYDQYTSCSISSRRNRKKPTYIDLDISDDEDDDLGLGSNKNYKMEKKELSFKEKEKEEETNLEKEITEMNNHLKLTKIRNDNEMDIQSTDTIDTDSHFSSSMIKSFNNVSNDEYNEQHSLRNSFLCQNISDFDEIIKLIIIGQKKVGKTLFIKKIVSSNSNNNNNNNSHNYNLNEYNPTFSLEIIKTIKTISNQKIKIEFWDTCETILNSDIIKTYYKISNGFIIIINKDTDMNFITKTFDIINHTIQRDIHFLLIYNDDQYKANSAYIFNEDFEDKTSITNIPKHIIESLNKLMQVYLLTILIVNLALVDIEKQKPFINYINDLLRTKSLTKFKSVNF